MKGQVLGPNHQAVTDAKLVCRSYLPSRLNFSKDVVPLGNGRFELPGVNPDKPCPVFLFDGKHELGAVVELSGKQASEKLLIRLSPCGAARARFVDEDRKPFVKHSLRSSRGLALLLIVTPGLSTYAPEDLQADAVHWSNIDRERHVDLRTDAEGRVTFPALIPSALYRILVFGEQNGPAVKSEFTVESGKIRDLGDIIMKRN